VRVCACVRARARVCVCVNFLPKYESLNFFCKYNSVTFNDNVTAYITNLQDRILNPEACVAVVFNLGYAYPRE
jgi:hypothetical protein